MSVSNSRKRHQNKGFVDYGDYVGCAPSRNVPKPRVLLIVLLLLVPGALSCKHSLDHKVDFVKKSCQNTGFVDDVDYVGCTLSKMCEKKTRVC